MKNSAYPRDYDPKKDGKRCAVKYRSLRKPRVSDFNNPNRMVEKFVLEGDLEQTGEAVSYWLGEDGKLVSLFQEELGRRVKAGKSDFEPGELIVITQSDEQRPSRTSGRPMWDYDAEFEHAAAPPTAAELMLGTSTAAGAVSLDEIVEADSGGSQLGPDEDLPF